MSPSLVQHPPPAPLPFGSAPHSAQREVQAVLLKQRPSRRRPGDVPYPIAKYTSELVNLDNWDAMFFKSCFGGLTAHKFDRSPTVILDLGTGGGAWATEAARLWPEAHIVGFDLQDIQPDLLELDAFYMRCLEDAGKSAHALPIAAELATRIEWLHGNFLDGLPFPEGTFDFVHIAGVGLATPEDEWPFVLQEVCRVLKPGGVVEIVEEDLIFPCASPRPARNSLAPLNLDFATRRDRRDSSAPPSAFSTRSSSTLFSDHWSVPDSPDDTRLQKKPSLPTLPESNTESPPQNSIPFDAGPPSEPLSRRDTLYQADLDIPLPPPDHDQHPQDHTRLKTAWDAMLSRRFLTSSVTTILPFYLSTYFDNVQAHPALQVPLPSGSFSPDPDARSSGDSLFDADTLFESSTRRLSDADMQSIKSRSTGASQRITPTWGRMHLAKTIGTVSACKEAMWAEYKILYPGDLPPVVATKTARPSNVTRIRALKHSPREAFETDWSNWEQQVADMSDRISMRAQVVSETGWGQPDPSPEARLWKTQMSYHREAANGASPRCKQELCRSVRTFVGSKAGP
ncbi:Methyltransf-25 domain-containing protein [Mycena kentingensis (nom. inval.)]|nr:Methyltransf-25 domain-containing protein [Mycena kentingensis (nom. inval.)]